MQPDIFVYKPKLIDKRKVIVTNDIGVRTFELNRENDLIAYVNLNGDFIIKKLRKDNHLLDNDFTGSDLLFQEKKIISNQIVRNTSNIGCKISWNPYNKNQICIPSGSNCITLYTQDNNDNSINSRRGWRSNYNFETKIYVFCCCCCCC